MPFDRSRMGRITTVDSDLAYPYRDEQAWLDSRSNPCYPSHLFRRIHHFGLSFLCQDRGCLRRGCGDDDALLGGRWRLEGFRRREISLLVLLPVLLGMSFA